MGRLLMPWAGRLRSRLSWAVAMRGPGRLERCPRIYLRNQAPRGPVS